MRASATDSHSPAVRTVLLAEVAVVAVERPSPSFVRITLGGDALADFGVVGPLVDQRIKLVFPPVGGDLPSFARLGESWYQGWLDLGDARGQMRTYTVRAVLGAGRDTRLVVDVVVHGDPPEGAGAGWAARAEVGHPVGIVAPRRGVDFGGREFDPGESDDLLLVGDESAVPAIAAILHDLPAAARGVVFAEVPLAEDVAMLPAPDGIDVRWLPRSGAAVGSRLVPAVRRHLGLGETPGSAPVPLPAGVDDVWETPTSPTGSSGAGGRYAWIAGESTVVRTLRRTLVGELGWDRDQVCFMGYWRLGVAMRS